MTPQELAATLHEELRESFAELAGVSPPAVDSVLPPADVGAGTSLLVTVSSASGKSLSLELPTTLAIGYLADEEAAVDEWKLWVAELVEKMVDTQ